MNEPIEKFYNTITADNSHNWIRYRGIIEFDGLRFHVYDDMSSKNNKVTQDEWEEMIAGGLVEVTEEDYMDAARDFLSAIWSDCSKIMETIDDRLRRWPEDYWCDEEIMRIMKEY